AQGLAATIYRAPLLGAARCTGASNSNDLVSRFIDQCLRVGCFPEITSGVNMIPVDDLSDRFVAIALGGSQGIRYNIVNDEILPIGRLVGKMKSLSGHSLRSVSQTEWLRLGGQLASGDVL